MPVACYIRCNTQTTFCHNVHYRRSRRASTNQVRGARSATSGASPTRRPRCSSPTRLSCGPSTGSGPWPQARSGARSPTSSVRPAEPSGSETAFPPTPRQPHPPARARSRQASRRPPACATAAARSSNRRGPTRVRSPRRTAGAASTSDSDAANSSTRRSEGDTSPMYAETAAKSIHAPAGLSSRAGARHTHGRAGPARPARINSSVAASRASMPRAHARSRASSSASCAGAQRAGPRSPPAGVVVTRTRSHRRGAGHRQPGAPRPRSGLVRQAAAARARRPAGDRCPAA